MSLTSTTSRTDAVGNGATAIFPYTFKIFEQTDLLVTVADTAGAETTLVLTTDYTVSGVGSVSGGNVTLVNASQAWLTGGFLTTGYAITIRRVMPLTQETDIRNAGDFFPEIHEDQFDRDVMIAQQQQDALDRSLRIPETEAGSSSLELPPEADRANNFLAFDASGNPVASSGGISSAIPVSAFIETLLDDANASAARTTLGAAAGVWPATQGGTGQSSYAVGDTLYASGVSALSKRTIGTVRQMLRVESGVPAWVDTPQENNWVINGNMDLWQRGASFASISASTYFADRWRYAIAGSSAVVSLLRSTDIPTLAESGYQSSYSTHVDCTTADAAVAAGDAVSIRYGVEGYEWGALRGRTITLSFWVKATKTGTYCVALKNNGSDRSYVAEYTVAVTATWEKKTVTIVLNPSGGTDNYLNGMGLQLHFALMAGATFQTTAGAWQTGDFLGTASQVNALDSASNDFRLSQVMFNLGTSAATFRRAGENVAEEISMAQRYYQKSFDLDTAPSAFTAGAKALRASATAPANWLCPVDFPVDMRATPTMTGYSAGTGTAGFFRNSTAATDIAAAFAQIGTTGVTLIASAGFSDQDGILAQYTADAEF